MTGPSTNRAENADLPGLHDLLQTRLLELGFGLSGQALHLLGSPPHQPATKATPPRATGEELAPYLHSFSERITAAIQELILSANGHIETGHLQELQYRARSLVLLLYGNKKPESSRYSDMLAESVTLLRERLQGSRWQWLGLTLAAQSLLVMARAGCDAETAELLTELRATDEQARRDLLDRLIPYLAPGQVPWKELTAFFYGEENHLLTWARSAAEKAASTHHGTALTPGDIREALTLLDPCQTIYYGEHIPEKKLHNARLTCAVDPGEEIVALLDCTVFGSAKDSVLFGTSCLYFYNFVGSGKQPGRLTYRELATRQPSAQGDFIDLGHEQHCFVVGSAVSAEQLLGVLARLRAVMLGGPGRVPEALPLSR